MSFLLNFLEGTNVSEVVRVSPDYGPFTPTFSPVLLAILTRVS